MCVVGRQGVYGISLFSAQFCCEPETALKNKVYLKKKAGSIRSSIHTGTGAWKIKDIMLLLKKKKVDKTNEKIVFQARMV